MKKDKKIEFRVTEKEKEILMNKAEKYGLSLSEYSRTFLLSSEPIYIDISAEQQIRKIGNNVNQLVRYAHSKQIVRSEDLINELRNLDKLIQLITKNTIKVK